MYYLRKVSLEISSLKLRIGQIHIDYEIRLPGYYPLRILHGCPKYEFAKIIKHCILLKPGNEISGRYDLPFLIPVPDQGFHTDEAFILRPHYGLVSQEEAPAPSNCIVSYPVERIKMGSALTLHLLVIDKELHAVLCFGLGQSILHTVVHR